MGDPDVRNALARRLQRNISETSNASKNEAAGNSALKKLPPATATPSTIEPFDILTVRVSGFLYKYSSGHLARWQKRFFVLESGRLSYFKRSPTSEKDTANKTFSMRKIKSVTSKDSSDADDREFGLLFSNGKMYQMRAPTNEDMRKWVSSLRGAIAYLEQSGGDLTNNPEGDGGFSDEDGMTSAQGSVMSENHPPDSPTHSSEHKISSRLHGLIPRRESLHGVFHAAGHGLSSIKNAVLPAATLAASPVDTSMLEVEIDPDQLDKNFEEWFYFVQASCKDHRSQVQIQRDIKMSHIADAVGRANQHLWSTLASLPRGSEVKLEEAVGRAKSRMGAPEAVERATIIIEEYLVRLSKYVQKSVDMRSASQPRLGHGRTTLGLGSDLPATCGTWISELPQLMDCITRVQSPIEKLLSSLSPKCLCCYCDPSGVGMLKLERQQGGKKNVTLPPVTCSQDKWRKSIRSLLQRIGGELEVGLIEELQNLIQSAELAWESHPRITLPTDDPIFGPCPQQHPLFDDMFVNPTPGVKMAPPKVLMSSFAPAFVQAAQTRCLNTASQWMAAYSSSARLISEHSSSALVASLNSVWRQFKRVATNATDKAHREENRKYTESVRNSREDALRSSVSSQGSSPTNKGRRKSSVGGIAVINDTVFDLEHLVSFSNECVLISRFCAKTWSNGVSAKFTPDVFLTCMEGLASGFLTTAVDTCHAVVSMHYLPRVRFDLNKMFHSKNLSQNHSTPMAYGKILTDQFIGSIEVLAPLGCVKEGIVNLLGPALMRAYMGALVRNKPRLKTFKTVPEMIRGDLETFKDAFVAGYKVPVNLVDKTLSVADALLKTINDRNRVNYSIHFNTIARLVGSKKEAFSVIQSVVKMREHEWKSASDKKEIANIISSIKTELTTESSQDNEVSSDTLKEESLVKKLPKGAVAVVLGVGELRVPWKFDE